MRESFGIQVQKQTPHQHEDGIKTKHELMWLHSICLAVETGSVLLVRYAITITNVLSNFNIFS